MNMTQKYKERPVMLYNLVMTLADPFIKLPAYIQQCHKVQALENK